MKKEDKKEYFYIILRYFLLLALMFALPLFHKIFSPITISPVVGILKLFYQVSLNENTIIINDLTVIQIIPACIAGSAYLLYLILNLSMKIETKKRIYSIITAFLLLLILNISRIILFAVLLVNNFQFFDFAHKIFWYGLSTILVIIIWFFVVKIFSIKEIPIFSDVKYILKNLKKK